MTCRPVSRSARPSPVQTKTSLRDAASDSKTRVRARQSTKFSHDTEMPLPARLVSCTKTIRSGSGNASGRNRMPSTIEKIAVDAPMPSASVATTASVNAGAFAYARTACFTSYQIDSTIDGRSLASGGRVDR